MSAGIYSLIGQSPRQILWWQMSIRAVLIFIFGLTLIRCFGRRVFGRQNPLDIILAIMIGSNLSRVLTGNARFLPTMAATAAVVLLFWLSDHLAARWPLFGRLTKGTPLRIMHHGRFDERKMRRFAVTRSDIDEAARGSGLVGLEAVGEAVLERNGKISTLAAKPE